MSVKIKTKNRVLVAKDFDSDGDPGKFIDPKETERHIKRQEDRDGKKYPRNPLA